MQPGQGIVPEEHQPLMAALNDAAAEGAGAVVYIPTEWYMDCTAKPGTSTAGQSCTIWRKRDLSCAI
jgi:hypothetical protein